MPDGFYGKNARFRQQDDGTAQSSYEKIGHLIRTLETGGEDSRPERAKTLNTFASHDATRGAFRELARQVRQAAEREWMGRLDCYSWSILSAIHARTLGFQKIAEAITYDHFRFGLRDYYPDGPLKRDAGSVIFAGSGVASKKNISAGLKDLLARGLISRWAYTERSAKHVIYAGIPLFLVRSQVIGRALLEDTLSLPGDRRQMKVELLDLFDEATRHFDQGRRGTDHPFALLVEDECRRITEAN